MVLHQFFETHLDTIGKDLISYNGTAARENLLSVRQFGKDKWDELCTILADLGSPEPRPTDLTLLYDNDDALVSVLRRNQSKNTVSVANIFYAVADDEVSIFHRHKSLMLMPVQDMAVFVFETQLLDTSLISLHLLAIHILRVRRHRHHARA